MPNPEPADGPPVILLHGWPYDIYSFAEVMPLLAARGFRTIAPYLRGYGPTRFLSPDTVRNGEPAALAQDLLGLMDALKIERAVLAGFDWGARTADIAAALWPERARALVSVSGYLIRASRRALRRFHPRPSCNGGTNSISRPSADARAMRNTVANSRS